MEDILQKATIEVMVNGENAKNDFQALEKYAISLKDRIAEAYNAGDTKKMKQLEKELTKTNSQLRAMRTNSVNIDEVMKNLSTAGPKELKKTLNAINKELASGRIKRGSKEWGEYQGKLKLVKAELTKIKAEGIEAEGFLSRMNNKLSKWGGMLASGLAALTGVSLAFSKMRKDADDKEENADNLKALTGLDDQSVAWLTKQSEILSTTLEKNGLRVKQSSKDILDAYMKVGSEKPELLSNKEALNATTIEAMRLAAAAKTDLDPAVQALTLSLNQYNKGAEYAAEFTNILAAGSQAGSANVMNQAAALKNCGVAAYSANIPMQETAGTIQTLAKFGIKDEMAGTGLKKFFLTLQTGSDETNPKVVGLEKALDNLNKKQLSAAQIKKQFGEEGYNVASILIRETELVKYFTKAVTGTNVAVEQATINSDNRAAKRAQMINQLREAGIELMNRLNPSINILGSYFTNMVKVMPSIIDFLQKYGKTIVYATTVVLTYIAAEKLQYFWTNKVKTATGEYIVIVKLKQLWDKAAAASTWLYIAATSALTGKTNQARLAMQAFFMLLKVHPLVAIATAVVAVASAIYMFATRTKNAKTVTEEFFSSVAEERNELNKIYNQLLRTNEKTGERTRLINEFNSNFGKYLTNLLDEKSTVEDIKKAYKEATTAMNDHYARELLASKQSEIVKGNIDKQSQSLKNAVDVAVNATKDQRARLSELINDVTNQVITDNPEYGIGNVRQKIYEKINKEFGVGSAYDLFGGSEGWEEFSKEIYPFIQGTNETINKVNKLKEELSPFIKNIVGNVDDPNALTDEKRKEIMTTLEADFAKVKAEQKALYVIGKITKQEFDAFVINSEMELIDSKMKLYSKDSKEYNDLLQQKLQIQKKQNQEFGKEDIQSIDNRIKKEKSLLLDSYADKRIDKKTFEEGILQLDYDAIKAKRNLYVKGSKEYNEYQAQLDDLNYKDRLKHQQEFEKKSIQSIDDRIKKEKRLLLDFYVDKRIDKKTFDEGILQLDYDAIKAKRNLYVKGSKEYNEYQTQLDDLSYKDRLKRQQEYEEKIKAFRSEYQNKTSDDLMQEAIKGWDIFHQAGIVSEEEYQKIIQAIRKKYAIKKGSEEVGYGKNDQKYAKETTDLVNQAKAKTGNKGNPETDSFWDNMFGNDAKLHSGILTELKSMEEQGLITHKQYLNAKSQADAEYAENLSSKMELAYSSISAVMSSYSAYASACQELETAKIEKKYEKEIAAAGNNSKKVAKLQEAKEKEIAKAKSKFNKKAMKIEIAQAFAGTAMSAINAYSSAAAVPLIGYILAPIAAAAAVAAGFFQIATIQKQHQAQEVGYYQGGFTGSGAWNEEKGVVHADEFVANRYAVRNKELLPVLRLIDNAQKNNTVGSLTASDVTTVLSGGKTTIPVSSSSDNNVSNATDAAFLISIMGRNTIVMEKLNKRLNEPFQTVNMVDGPDGIKQALDKYESLQKNKSRG